MMYILLFHFLNICSQEDLWYIARNYQKNLDKSKKISFYSQDEWKKLSAEDQNAIRTVLLFKHAEIRNAPLHKLRLTIFNRTADYINEQSQPQTVSYKDPIHSWVLETNDAMFDKPHKSLVLYHIRLHSDNISHKYKRSQHFSLKNEGYSEDIYHFDNDCLYHQKSPDHKSFLPLSNVHSICPLDNRNIGIFSAWMGSLDYGQPRSGHLITLKNGMQLVWNQDKKQVLPVGFCRQQNPEEDSYVYCKRMHEYFYTLKKPSQAFTRLYLKRFLWDTPQKWYWHMQIKGIFSLLATFGFFTCLYASFKSRELAILEALSIFEKELAEKKMIFPQILREQIRK